MPEKKTPLRSLLAGVVLIITLIGVLIALLNQQQIIDTVRSLQYEPSSEVVDLRQQLGLTDKGKLYFDASQTSLQPASEFNQHCQQYKETNNPILGCYVAQQIFVFDVDNPRLDGIEETTAAHEVLHAAYERLPDDEKRALNKLLQAAYDKVKTNELMERMKYYEKTEPGETMNELHSILGTEERTLGPELEKHYAQYFLDREKVVRYYESYNAVFTSAIKRLKDLELRINSTTARINADIRSYNENVADFESDAEVFRQRSRNGEYATQAQFNAAQSELLARQSALDATRNAINQAIHGVKVLRQEYNQLVLEYNQLGQSINSSLTPVPSLK